MTSNSSAAANPNAISETSNEDEIKHFCPRNGIECEFTTTSSLLSRRNAFEAVEVRQCTKCGIGLTFPLVRSIESLYEARESDDFEPHNTRAIVFVKYRAFLREARTFLATLTKKPRSVADFGCGDGLYSRALAAVLGPHARVSGLDFHQERPTWLTGSENMDYFCYDALDQVQGKFDLVVARHVLEHSLEPVQMLHVFKKLLTPDGVLFVEVPNFGSPFYKIFGKYWVGWYLPYHRVHFTRASLVECAEAAGLKINGISGYERPCMGQSLRNLFGVKHNSLLFVAGILSHPFQILVAKLSRQPTCLRILLTNDAAPGKLGLL